MVWEGLEASLLYPKICGEVSWAGVRGAVGLPVSYRAHGCCHRYVLDVSI